MHNAVQCASAMYKKVPKFDRISTSSQWVVFCLHISEEICPKSHLRNHQFHKFLGLSPKLSPRPLLGRGTTSSHTPFDFTRRPILLWNPHFCKQIGSPNCSVVMYVGAGVHPTFWLCTPSFAWCNKNCGELLNLLCRSATLENQKSACTLNWWRAMKFSRLKVS